MGKRKGKQGEKPSSDSAGSAASGQQTLMNNLKMYILVYYNLFISLLSSV